MADRSPALSYQQWQYELGQAFTAAHIDNPMLDARVLVAAVNHMSETQLVLHGEDIVPPAQSQKLCLWRDARLAGTPVSRLIGHREFYGLDFKINAHVLDPRPDSETVVDAVMAQQPAAKSVLDLGTGSGCLIISILHQLPDACGVAVDKSPAALRVARLNAHRLKVRSRLALRQGHWFAGLGSNSGDKRPQFDVIVSNPPYIASHEIAALQVNVRDHDPRLALDGGADGLRDYRHIIAKAEAYLKPAGGLYFEIGHRQADEVVALLRRAGYENIHVKRDLAGLDRLVVAVKKN